jgi:2',3'-cyclic-nucleotide 2'-phosphodiesterase (5'-nucleotidase family)
MPVTIAPSTHGDGRMASLSISNGDTCDVYLYGATVTSWKVGGEELLFVRYALSLRNMQGEVLKAQDIVLVGKPS